MDVGKRSWRVSENDCVQHPESERRERGRANGSRKRSQHERRNDADAKDDCVDIERIGHSTRHECERERNEMRTNHISSITTRVGAG